MSTDQAQQDARDAARYRWLREFYTPATSRHYEEDIDRAWYCFGNELDAAVDAEISKQKEQQP